MQRIEWEQRARELAKRGNDLPQAKLTDDAVAAIKSAARQRENMRAYIRENLSNEALAKASGVHIRTIEKILQCHTWAHVA